MLRQAQHDVRLVVRISFPADDQPPSRESHQNLLQRRPRAHGAARSQLQLATGRYVCYLPVVLKIGLYVVAFGVFVDRGTFGGRDQVEGGLFSGGPTQKKASG